VKTGVNCGFTWAGWKPVRGSRTFPAVVLRLMRNGAVVRDYTVSATVMGYVLEYLDFVTDKKLEALRQFIEAFRVASRVVNAEEGGEL